MSLIDKIAYPLFGKWAWKNKEYYYRLQKRLRGAHIALPFDRYVSNAIFYSIIVGCLGAVLGYGVANYVLAVSATTIAGVHVYEILLRVLIMSCLGLIFGQIIYRIILWYPSAVTNIRKTGINVDLPNAVSFMYALSKGGMNLIDIFKSLSEHADIYGEAAKEITVIVKDIEFFGHDLQTALRNISGTTPSEKFRDFAEGLISVIAAGGSVATYFSTKSHQYQSEATQEQKTFLEMLGMIGEMYVTALVAGPLFLIVTVVVMSMMGSEQTLLLNIIIYAVIPFASLGFIVLLDTMSKSISGRVFYTTTKELKVFEKARIEGGERERGLFKAIKWHIRTEKLKDFLRNPFKLFYEEPKRTLYLSVPIALTYFFIKAYPYLQALTFHLAMPTWTIASKGMLDNCIVFAVLISLTPFAIFYEIRERRVKKIEEAMPDFLRGLASSQEVGMTLTRAIKMVMTSNLGVLSSEVRRIWREIEWGSPVRDAFIRFENRVKTGFVARTVTLITKASEVSGNIKDVLSIAATDAQVTRTMKDERKMNMFMYVIVVYISFGVFLLIVYVLAATFLPLMPSSGAEMGGGGMGMGGGGIDVDLYTRLFFHAALIQGFFSGLIAGHMGEGHVFSGIKHALIMITITFLVFTVFI
ncbi:MAG: type II secretion system F family protein [Methanophagales archaeon]|nr:type II secretion system F family protein [Methanophagales archaeon]